MTSVAAMMRDRLLFTSWRRLASFWFNSPICSTVSVTGSVGNAMRNHWLKGGENARWVWPEMRIFPIWNPRKAPNPALLRVDFSFRKNILYDPDPKGQWP